MTALHLALKTYPARFRMTFTHAAAARAVALNVICVARHGGGAIGYGEGCPRRYVTGETLATAGRFFAQCRADIESRVTDLESLRAWIGGNREVIDANPAAFTAIEMALVDLFAKRAGVTLEELLGLGSPRPLQVSALFGVMPSLAAAALAAAYRAFAMTDAKAKLSRDSRADRRRLRTCFRILGSTAKLRVDANNLFAEPQDCSAHLEAIGLPVWAIEEPLASRDRDGMQALAAATGARIILDESAVKLQDLEPFEGDGWIVNLRVSKHGGILRSLEMLEAARRRGLGIIIGSHVGETGLLCRAAIALGAACGDALLASECGYGSYLLARDLVHPGLRFQRQGLLVSKGRAPGLAAGVHDDLLRDLEI